MPAVKLRYNRILYIAILAASSVFVYFYGGKVPYIFFHVVVLLPLVSLICAFLSLAFFRYRLECENSLAVKGDRLTIGMRITNRTPLLYPSIRVTFFSADVLSQHYQAKNLSMDPFSERTVNFEADCLYRGAFEFGVKTVEFVDFLGIFRIRKRKNVKQAIQVFPRIVYIERSLESYGFNMESLSAPGRYTGDIITFADVRKYQYGDPFRQIHWKLTAKTNEFQIKNYHKGIDSRLDLILDLKKSGLKREENIKIEDKLIEAAVALIHNCLSMHVPVRFSYAGNYIEAGDLSGFDEIYAVLSAVEFTADSNMDETLYSYANESAVAGNIIIMTSHVDKGLFSKLKSINFPGYSPGIVYVSAVGSGGGKDREAEETLGLMTEAGMHVIIIEPGEEIDAAFERDAV